jgi:hypothetical protein
VQALLNSVLPIRIDPGRTDEAGKIVSDMTPTASAAPRILEYGTSAEAAAYRLTTATAFSKPWMISQSYGRMNNKTSLGFPGPPARSAPKIRAAIQAAACQKRAVDAGVLWSWRMDKRAAETLQQLMSVV